MLEKENYNELLDLKMDINVNIGTIKMKFEEISALEKGSIIDFKVSAGESAQCLVNNKMIGKGEIMVFEQFLAIRLNEMLDIDKIIGEGLIL
jgi:flagellar motor switch protein FliN/FliY